MIGADGEQVGVVETAQAIKMAEDLGLDLVEISPDARPPVCKIMDFGKFKYEQSKKDQKNRSSSKASEMKEIRLGRSVKIDPHDVEIRVNQARRFLMDGHKVLITQRFRGREMAHRELGVNRLNDIAKKLADIGKLEAPPRWMGPQASIIVAPDKLKAEAAKRAMLRAKSQEKKDTVRFEKRAEEEAARLAAEARGEVYVPPAPAPVTTPAAKAEAPSEVEKS